MNITIQLFGATRDYANSDSIKLTVPNNATIADVRAHMADKLSKEYPRFNHDGLFDHSVFADETQVLTENAVIEDNATLTILPPVCGG